MTDERENYISTVLGSGIVLIFMSTIVHIGMSFHHNLSLLNQGIMLPITFVVITFFLLLSTPSPNGGNAHD